VWALPGTRVRQTFVPQSDARRRPVWRWVPFSTGPRSRSRWGLFGSRRFLTFDCAPAVAISSTMLDEDLTQAGVS